MALMGHHTPTISTVSGMSDKLPFNVIGDDTFSISTQVMKPYPQRNLDRTKRIFNYRTFRARRTVENAFGILANRFHVFLLPIQSKLIEKKTSYLSENTKELTILPGAWTNDP